MRYSLLLIVCFALVSATGCRVCQDCDDCSFPAVGGSWQRTDPNCGRVASVFAPAGAKVASTAQATPISTGVWNPGDSDEQDGDGEDDTQSLMDDLMDEVDQLTPEPVVEPATAGDST